VPKFLFIIFVFLSSNLNATPHNLELGCGWSDLVYDYIKNQIKDKSKHHFPLKSQGNETGRRLFIYENADWFLTFEFFSEEDVSKDISCIVAKGTKETLESSLDYKTDVLPDWKWGQQ
jgi:hypothetical protein